MRTAIRRDLAPAIRRARSGLRYVPPEAERCLKRRQRRPHLTSRESTVLALLAEARSNAVIAEVKKLLKIRTTSLPALATTEPASAAA